MNLEPGLRERKKQRTRETIARAAHELFVQKGYDATTLPDIAQAADVSTRTIFAYFASKEDILFSDFPVLKEALAQALADRPDGEEALETVREFILSSRGIEKSELDEELNRCVLSDETLRNHLRARIVQLEDLIAAAIAKDLGAAENDLRPHLVAASLTAAFIALSERSDAGAKSKSPAETAALVDPVIDFLRGGLDALKKPSAHPR